MKKKALLLLVLAIFLAPKFVFAAPNVNEILVGSEEKGIHLKPATSTKTYNLTFYGDKAEITVKTDEGNTVTGAGWINLKVGEVNTHVVTITDAAGEKAEYTLNLTAVANSNSTAPNGDIKNPDTGAFVGIASASIALIVGASVIAISKKKNKLNHI